MPYMTVLDWQWLVTWLGDVVCALFNITGPILLLPSRMDVR